MALHEQAGLSRLPVGQLVFGLQGGYQLYGQLQRVMGITRPQSR